MGFPYIGQRSQTFREPGVLRIFSLRSEEYASSSLDSLPLSALWSYSSVSLAQRVLRHISTFSHSHTSCFISFLLAYLPCSLSPVLTCCFRVDMGFNKDKKKKLADLLAKRRMAAAGVGTSTPIAPQPQLPLLPTQSSQSLLLIRKRGWWSSRQTMKTHAPVLSSKDKGWVRPWPHLLLFLAGPQLSGTTPRAPLPRANLSLTKVGERVLLGVKRCLLLPSFPRCFSESSIASKTRRCWRAWATISPRIASLTASGTSWLLPTWRWVGPKRRRNLRSRWRSWRKNFPQCQDLRQPRDCDVRWVGKPSSIYLSFKLFNFSLYILTGINNQLFLRNNRLFLRNNRLFFWCCANLLCVFGKLSSESSFLEGISF